MKRLFLIGVCAIGLSGCSYALRSGVYRPIEGSGWSIEDASATYACGKISLVAKPIEADQLMVVGPLVPLVPLWHTHRPLPLELVMSGEGHDGKTRCPVVSLGGNRIEAYQKTEYQLRSSCYYGIARDLLGSDTVAISFLLSSPAGGRCAIPELRFGLRWGWRYSPTCLL